MFISYGEPKSANNYGMSKIDVIDSELHARGCGVRSQFAGIVLMFIEIYSLIYINGESEQRPTESLTRYPSPVSRLADFFAEQPE